MVTPVFCCGFECGQAGGAAGTVLHLVSSGGTITNQTAIVNAGGSIRAARYNVSSSSAYHQHDLTATRFFVSRFYVYFTTLPSGNTYLNEAFPSSTEIGAFFNQSDSKIYAARGAPGSATKGATGVAVTTGVWYRIDLFVNTNANPWTCDVKVNGTACGQASNAVAAADMTATYLGMVNTNTSGDLYIDDLVYSATLADYPIGAGKVLGFVPNADGTHTFTTTIGVRGTLAAPTAGGNIAGSTDSYLWLNNRPMPGGATDGTFLWNHQTTGATLYGEVLFEDASEIPRGVEVLVALRDASTATGDRTAKLNDNGTEDTIYASGVIAGITSDYYRRKHYALAPSTGTPWTLSLFNGVRFRFGYSNDATPDHYCRGVMIEAEFGVASTQAAAGTITPSGALVRLAQKVVSGAIASAGALARLAQRFLSGSIASAGTLVRATQKKLSGTIASTGSLSTSITIVQTFSGVIASSGVLVRQAQGSLSGTITSTGSLLTRISVVQTFVGSIASAGSLIRQTQALLSGAITSSGSLATNIAYTFTGTITSAGSLIRQAQIQISAVATPVGSLARSATQALAGALTPSGALYSTPQKAFSGTLSFTGSLATQSLGILLAAGAITPTSILAFLAQKVFSRSLGSSGSTTKEAQTSYIGVLSPAGDPIFGAETDLAGTVTLSGSLSTVVIPSGTLFLESMAGSITPSGALTTLVIVAPVPPVVVVHHGKGRRRWGRARVTYTPRTYRFYGDAALRLTAEAKVRVEYCPDVIGAIVSIVAASTHRILRTYRIKGLTTLHVQASSESNVHWGGEWRILGIPDTERDEEEWLLKV